MKLPIALLMALMFCIASSAQTATFTYQGQLTDTGMAANGTYDLQFTLYDDAGAQIGETLTREDVIVRNGVFTVSLNFGAAAFNGDNRVLGIAVKRSGETGEFTALMPRQPITSTPYAIRASKANTAEAAQNAAQLGGTAASGFVLTDDARLADARPPTANSNSYIQNKISSAQAGANFNIGGTGAANLFNALTQYNIGGSRVLSNAGTSNLFAGVNAGSNNSSGQSNSFFGSRAGFSNIGGTSNSFFGANAGELTTGNNNSLFGRNTGSANTTGFNNSFFGINAGLSNTTGGNNTLIGSFADVGANNLTYATALGAGASVGTSNTIVIGRSLETVKIPGNLNLSGTFTGSFTVPAANITGVIPTASGGTGLGAPGASGNFLRSNGTNWISVPLDDSSLPTSANYVHNSTTLQPSTNFHVGGNGTASGTLSGNIVNSSTQFNLGGVRVLSNTGTDNLFTGVSAGAANAGGAGNSFVGKIAGLSNTTGNSNSFFGFGAGELNTSGNYNTFFGAGAGKFNRTGSYNTIVGYEADITSNLTYATALGAGAFANTSNTVVLGRNLDTVNVPGNLKVEGTVTASFPASNITGVLLATKGGTGLSSPGAAGNYLRSNGTTFTSSSFLAADVPNLDASKITTGIFSTARLPDLSAMYIRNQSVVQSVSNFNISGNGTAGGTLSANISNASLQFNLGGVRVLSNAGGTDNLFAGVDAGSANAGGAHNSFFGKSAGNANTTGKENSFFGRSAGGDNTTGEGNTFFGVSSGSTNTTGSYNTYVGYYSGVGHEGSKNTLIGYNADIRVAGITYATAIGTEASVLSSNNVALGRLTGADKVTIYGLLELHTLGGAGATALCRNAAEQISICSSSLRYKTNIAPFSFGLNVVNQLRPISFDWTKGGMKDVGFGAEDVARINPLFVTYNKAGEVEGVKYDRLSVAFVNAFKEQQAQIETQREQINRQQREIDELKGQQAQLNALKATVCALKPDAAICKETSK